MLLLTRKRDETIRIGDDVEIVVVHIHPGKVRIGIRAPRNVLVMRGELVTDNKDHAGSGPPQR